MTFPAAVKQLTLIITSLQPGNITFATGVPLPKTNPDIKYIASQLHLAKTYFYYSNITLRCPRQDINCYGSCCRILF